MVTSVDDLGQGARGGAPRGDGGAPGPALLRQIPRTDQLLADPRMRAAERRVGRDLVKAAITRAQDRARTGEIPPDLVADTAAAELPATATSLTPVINATGVLVHTNLGRAPLSRAATDALLAAAGTCDVEFDLDTGIRAGQRGRGVTEALRRAVPGAAAAGVVNNNAAALVLAATALAGGGREIVISRGELIEIGDRFRLPDLLISTGARLREVGTTNRTTAEDYQQAITADTGFILKVHPSNYRVEGFTRQATVAELAALGVTLVHDIGSGLLAPHPLLPDEPDAATSLAHGANLVTASGDKLLGGPQAGILLGDQPLVRRLLRHPLARALRVDKLTLAALEATLSGPPSPVARALAADPAALSERAARIVAALAAHAVPASVAVSEAAVGGGGAPGVTLPSAAVALPAELAPALRRGPGVRRGESPAVAGRIAGGMLLLDLRSVDPADDERLVAAVLLAAGAR
jgi:L-seryl-tRNA(Ser) seleniumtransferase